MNEQIQAIVAGNAPVNQETAAAVQAYAADIQNGGEFEVETADAVINWVLNVAPAAIMQANDMELLKVSMQMNQSALTIKDAVHATQIADLNSRPSAPSWDRAATAEKIQGDLADALAGSSGLITAFNESVDANVPEKFRSAAKLTMSYPYGGTVEFKVGLNQRAAPKKDIPVNERGLNHKNIIPLYREDKMVGGGTLADAMEEANKRIGSAEKAEELGLTPSYTSFAGHSNVQCGELFYQLNNKPDARKTLGYNAKTWKLPVGFPTE